MADLRLVQDSTSIGNWTDALSAANLQKTRLRDQEFEELVKESEKLLASVRDMVDADARVDSQKAQGHTPAMNDITSGELGKTLSDIEERMDKRVDRIEKETDRRSAEFQREIEIRDAAFKNEQTLRDKALDERFSSFFAVQSERDKSQLERDKRYELLADRVTKAAEGAEEAAKQAATVKANYWAAVGVQLLAVVAILVGAYYANQASVFGAMQTTMSAIQAGKDGATPTTSTPLPSPEQQKK